MAARPAKLLAMSTPRAALLRVAACGAAGVALALVLLPLAERLPNSVVPDDGYFYARIAFNLARLGRSTFDGVHTTSGYHLPWAVALAAVSRVAFAFSSDPRAHLAGHLALAGGLGIFTALRFFRGALFRVAALAAFLSTFGLTEMALAIPLLLALLEGVASEERRPPPLWLALALPVVRVDLVCVPLAIALTLWRDRRRAAALAAAGILGALLQLGTMRLVFGHFFGVAAWLKMNGALGLVDRLAANLGGGAFALFAYAAHLGVAALVLARASDRALRPAVAGGLAFLALHTCASVLRPWYWAPSWLAVLFLLERAKPSDDERLTRRLAPAAIAAAFAVHAARAEIVYAADARTAAAFLAELRARVPEDERIFTFDNPGFLGFFSGRDVVDADGLVNDDAYAERYLGGRLAGYLAEERLCWIVTDDVDRDPVLSVAGLVVRRDEVTRLVALRRQRANQSDFALDRLRATHCPE